MLQALQGSLRVALCRPLFWKFRAENRANNPTEAPLQVPPTPLEKLIQLVAVVWRTERPHRQPGSLPLGMLELARDTIVNYRSTLNFQCLRLCVYMVDELATAYTAGSRRDPRYTRVFVSISTALRPICEHTTQPSGSTTWFEKLNATLNNTSCAGGLEIHAAQARLDSDAETSAPPSSPVKEWVLQRIRSRTVTIDVEDNV
jgi:hypothetical protein